MVNEWYLRAPATAESRDVFVTTSYSGEASGCVAFAGHEVDETDDTVTITITVTLSVRRGAGDCTEELVVREIDVRLDRPVGSRALEGCGHGSCESVRRGH